MTHHAGDAFASFLDSTTTPPQITDAEIDRARAAVAPSTAPDRVFAALTFGKPARYRAAAEAARESGRLDSPPPSPADAGIGTGSPNAPRAYSPGDAFALLQNGSLR